MIRGESHILDAFTNAARKQVGPRGVALCGCVRGGRSAKETEREGGGSNEGGGEGGEEVTPESIRRATNGHAAGPDLSSETPVRTRLGR